MLQEIGTPRRWETPSRGRRLLRKSIDPMLTYPKIDPVLFSVGPLRIHWYGIMYLLAFGSAWWLARRRAAQPGSTWALTDIDNLIFSGVLGVIVGGRIGYVLFYGWSLWREDWLYPLK